MGICIGLAKVAGAKKYLEVCGNSLSQNEYTPFGIPLLVKVGREYIKEQKAKLKDKKISKLENKTQ